MAIKLLTDKEQHTVWWLMMKGASPALACQQAGASIEAFWLTVRNDTEFLIAIRQMFDTLDHNVVSAMYRQAIEGSVAAQKYWLDRRPAALWSAAATAEDEPNEFAKQSDDELAEALRAKSGDLAAASARLETPPAV